VKSTRIGKTVRTGKIERAEAMTESDPTELDATGLKCPLPVLKARKALKPLEAGARLRVRATDPGAPADLRAFCDQQNHILLEQQTAEDGSSVTLIAKG
jgi:tRNA 2-thiouridine synthesizing protein A